MNILISNDDGYKSGRLLMLKDILSLYGDVYISAPLTQKSGSSVSLTIHENVKYKVIDKNYIAIKGTPADSVSCGLGYFKDIEFDLVVTGINYGYNTSKDTLYSGTVGAAIIGAFNGIKTIALSAQYEDDPYLYDKASFIMDYIFKNKLLDIAPLLNVNIPKGEAKGIKVGRIYPIPINDYVIKFKDSFLQARDLSQEKLLDDSDLYLVENGYYAISAMKPSLEDNELNNKLMEIIK